jgi:hypothetical protein
MRGLSAERQRLLEEEAPELEKFRQVTVRHNRHADNSDGAVLARQTPITAETISSGGQ